MSFRKLTYQSQIFLSSLLLVIIPSIIMGLYTANSTVRRVNDNYRDTLDTMTSQTNMTLDTLLLDAEKVGYIYLFDNDISKILNTNYGDNLLKFAQDNTKMVTQIKQANSINTNVVSCIVKNRYGYCFDYNILTYKDSTKILENMEKWSGLARKSGQLKYYGFIQHPQYTGNIYKSILPMVKILYDPFTKTELGTIYISINFDPIIGIVNSSALKSCKMLLFNADNELAYSSNSSFPSTMQDNHLLDHLSGINAEITEDKPQIFDNIDIDNMNYIVSGVYNNTTGWKIISYMDDSIVKNAYYENINMFFFILVITTIFAFIFAFLLAHSITKPIDKLCNEIDSCEVGDLSYVTIKERLSNRELQHLANSYNLLNQRLADSLNRNYTILLNEKQLKLQVLKTQINHHFLYNSLNVISSIANIHDIPDICTISNSISEILRYNLKSGLVVILESEILQLSQYLAIQKIRFPDEFDYECFVADEVKYYEIPAFILQPIVENSFHHGFLNKNEKWSIRIKVFAEDNLLHILISDNGSGISSEKLTELTNSFNLERVTPIKSDSHHSIGLLNVHQRIRTYYGFPYGLSISSILGKGTTVEITFPCNQKPQLSFTMNLK